VKAGGQLTKDERYAIALQLPGGAGFAIVRNPAIIATNSVTVWRTADVTKSLYKDILHLDFHCGTNTRIYEWEAEERKGEGEMEVVGK
jgi:hypothetical protein